METVKALNALRKAKNSLFKFTDEAGKIKYSNYVRIYFYIALPSTLPTITVLIIFNLIISLQVLFILAFLQLIFGDLAIGLVAMFDILFLFSNSSTLTDIHSALWVQLLLSPNCCGWYHPSREYFHSTWRIISGGQLFISCIFPPPILPTSTYLLFVIDFPSHVYSLSLLWLAPF